VIRSDLIVDEGARLEVKMLADGDRLIKDGPRVWMSYYGSGQCGACPRAGITIYYEDKSSGKLLRALDHVGVVEGEGSDIDYTVSDDWQRVELYEGKGDTLSWTQTSFCLRSGDRKYQECGHKNNVQPPNPRTLNPDSIFH
jgi:hypothetical protein